MVSWIWLASARSASSSGTRPKRGARKARMFAVCATTASPTFTNGAANGRAPGCPPSREAHHRCHPALRPRQARDVDVVGARLLEQQAHELAASQDRRPVIELDPFAHLTSRTRRAARSWS